jgi:CBS domain-containing protein
MTTSVRTLNASQSLAEAARLMKAEDAGSIPVIDDGRLVGIVTDRDIAIRGIAEGIDPSTSRIGQIASRDLVMASPEQDLDDALNLMARHQVRRLPVVDRNDGHLVGIIAQADIAIAAKEKQTGELVEQISQPTSTPS